MPVEELTLLQFKPVLDTLYHPTLYIPTSLPCTYPPPYPVHTHLPTLYIPTSLPCTYPPPYPVYMESHLCTRKCRLLLAQLLPDVLHGVLLIVTKRRYIQHTATHTHTQTHTHIYTCSHTHNYSHPHAHTHTHTTKLTILIQQV